MIKNKIVGAVAAAMLLLPLLASAATTQTFLTLDGVSNNTYTVGSTFNAKLSFDLTGTDTLQSIKWEILNASNQAVLPFECQDVDPDFLTAGSYATEFAGHTLGGSQGTWKIRVSTYGVAVPGANNNCTGVPVNTRTYNNVLTLTNDNSSGTVINNTGSGSGTSAGNSNTIPAWFTLYLQSQCTASGGTWSGGVCTHPAPVPIPTGNAAKCAAIASYLGAAPYTYSSLGVQLQSALLLDNPMSIPALHAGATIPMGYFGVQTHAALAAYQAMYHCI